MFVCTLKDILFPPKCLEILVLYIDHFKNVICLAVFLENISSMPQACYQNVPLA